MHGQQNINFYMSPFIQCYLNKVGSPRKSPKVTVCLYLYQTAYSHYRSTDTNGVTGSVHVYLLQ